MLVEALCVKAGRLNDGRIELAMECWRIASWPLDVSPPGRLSSVAFGVVSPELTSNLTVWGKKSDAMMTGMIELLRSDQQKRAI